jgi:hypothetical protein
VTAQRVRDELAALRDPERAAFLVRYFERDGDADSFYDAPLRARARRPGGTCARDGGRLEPPRQLVR